MNTLKFSISNAKLKALAHHMGYTYKQVVGFDLPAGFTCPKAQICATYSNRDTGKITRKGKIICYASRVEAYAPSARRLRWHNIDSLQASDNKAELIISSLPANVKVVRIHSSGDFYSKEYFMAWVEVARRNPNIIFYGYTKIMEYALFNKPENFKLQYSYGSKDDSYRTDNIPTCFIGEYDGQYPYQVVCGSHDKSHEDFYAIMAGESFVIGQH